MGDDLQERFDDLEAEVERLEDRIDTIGQDYVAVDQLREQVERLQRLVSDIAITEVEN
jgi:archaellum component FlaC